MAFEAPDYAQFDVPVHRFGSVDDALPHFGRNGLYSIDIGHGDLPLDLLVSNFPQEDSKPVSEVIVAFAGAVPNRAKKSGPFFGFAGVCQRLGGDVPFVCISDPSLYLDNSLNLSWYSGNRFLPDLQEKIAYLLDGIIARYKCRLVLLGASGGGFAALRILELIGSTDVSVFTWNPQVRISKYELWAVRRYLKVCFGVNPSELKSVSEIESCLHSLGVANETAFVQGKGKIIYFINSDDSSHIFDHMNHYFRAAPVERINENNFLSGNCLIHVGEFGKGHAGPDKPMVLETIADVVADRHALLHKCVRAQSKKAPLWVDLQTSVRLAQHHPNHYLLDNYLICSCQLSNYTSFATTWSFSDGKGNETVIQRSVAPTIAVDLRKFEGIETLHCTAKIEGILGKAKLYKYALKINDIPQLHIA